MTSNHENTVTGLPFMKAGLFTLDSCPVISVSLCRCVDKLVSGLKNMNVHNIQ
jgi:hypothetical protein